MGKPDHLGQSVWCGRCYRNVKRVPGCGGAWRLWICPCCLGSLGVRAKHEDAGPVPPSRGYLESMGEEGQQ